MSPMAKKKQFKKHKLKHGEQEPAAESRETRQVEAPKPKQRVASPIAARAITGAGNLTERDFSYVGRDLRKVLILAASLIAAELVLWVLFSHTGLGTKVYQVIQP
jgi:hypothetical protein